MKREIKQKRKKKKLGSYPYISVVLSITLALVVVGLFGLLLLYSGKLAETVKNNVEIQVFLKKSITENQRIKIQKTLNNKYFTATEATPDPVVYVSKEQAAKEFIGDNPEEDFTQLLEYNPLRDSYILKIKTEYHTEEKFAAISTEIEAINGVFEVAYPEHTLGSINKNITKASIFLIGFAIVLLIAVAILINNTIKLALFSQRFLIRSMQLVGAKSGFIQRPFLVRASLHGIMSGILASLLIIIMVNYANRNIEDLTSLQDNKSLIILFSGLVLMGAIVGFGSTYRSINKYLRLSLDDLY